MKMEGRHNGTLLDSKNGYRIIDCKECGFVHVQPVPAPDELDRIYKEEYYTKEKPLFIERQIEDLPWWNLVYDERYDFFERNLSKSSRSLIDIGCGPGFFLKKGKDGGWDVYGIEPSLKASEHAKGLGINVINSFLFDSPFDGRKFHAAHMSEVLEHVADPISLCRKTYELLEPGGIFCVSVPNDYNPLQKLLRAEMGYEPYWLAPPHHINYFNHDSLKGLLRRCGFEIIGEAAMFPMEFFLLMGDNYVGDDAMGRLCHSKRKRLDIALSGPGLSDFRNEFNELLAAHGMGREIIMFGKKEISE